MCCPTGLCGPVQDQTLLDLLETVRALESNGVKVARYQPGSHPSAFMSNADVMAAVRARNTAALPITVVNGRIVKSGAYASLDELQDALSGGAR
jgi:pseudouridine-5'-phosphate glycosidase